MHFDTTVRRIVARCIFWHASRFEHDETLRRNAARSSV